MSEHKNKEERNTCLDSVVVEVETLLNDRGQFTNASSLLAQHLLGLGGQDDDLGTSWRHANLNTAVAIFGKLLGEEVVQLGLEDTSADELSTKIQQQQKNNKVSNLYMNFRFI